MRSITDKYWILDNVSLNRKQGIVLSQKLNVTPELIELLEKRGVKGYDALEKFLYPTLKDLPSPNTMKDMEKACEIILETLIKKRKIVIWGDYDVDGVTSTCLLLRFFHYLGVFPQWFIPDRIEDGYGLNTNKLSDITDDLKGEEALLITVDCGVSNFEEVSFLKKSGWKVIITDHHEPGEKMPEADAVINVKQKTSEFSDMDIAGVGTAFYLIAGLRSYLLKKNYFSAELPSPNLKEYLELVAIGTIADMVPLKNSNRILVKAGFEIINSSPSIGLAALLKESDIRYGNITSDDIAFLIGPKINAAGRLVNASLAVELLLEKDKVKARKKAKKLSSLNNKRKKLCKECLESTLSLADIYLTNEDSLCLLKVEDSIGILGIVASQLVEKLRVPVILVTEIEDKKYGRVLKGSCRSVPGLNLFESLQECSSHLIQYGGHKMAAGVTLYEKDFAVFKKNLSVNIQRRLQNSPRIISSVDLELDVEVALGKEFIQQMQLLEPFGVDNEKPIFINNNSMLIDIKRVGKQGDHLTLKRRGRLLNHKCVAFNFGKFESELRDRSDFNIIYTVMLSRFRQSVTWQVNLLDLV